MANEIVFFVITITAVVYSLFSLHLTKTVGNRERVKQIQNEVNRVSAKMKDMAKMSEKQKQEFQKEQDMLPQLLTESMLLQFKPLLISLPIFIALSYLIRTYITGFVITLGFSIPTFPYYWLLMHFDNFPDWRNTFGSFGWFLLMLFATSLISQLLIPRIQKLVQKKVSK